MDIILNLPRVFYQVLILIACHVTPLFVGGCQQENDSLNAERAAQGGASQTHSSSEGSASVDQASLALPPGVRVDKDGKKWIDDVPYNIWFDEPLAKVEPSDLMLSPAEVTKAVQPKSTPEPATPNSVAEQADSGNDWKSLVSAKVLENEVTTILNELGTALRQLGTFNKSLDEVNEQSVALTAISLVASQHPDEVRWKEQALVLADCGSRLQEHSQTKGRAAFKANQIPTRTDAVYIEWGNRQFRS